MAILKKQILELSASIRSLDERVEWFSAQLESHEYRIAELEQTVFLLNDPPTAYEPFSSWEHHESGNDSYEAMHNWDDSPVGPLQPTFNQPPPTEFMHISPNTSFSHDGISSDLSYRHVPLPTNTVLQPKRLGNPSQSIDFHK